MSHGFTAESNDSHQIADAGELQQWPYEDFLNPNWPQFQDVPLLPVDPIDFSTVEIDLQHAFPASDLQYQPILTPSYSQTGHPHQAPSPQAFTDSCVPNGIPSQQLENFQPLALDDGYIGYLQQTLVTPDLHQGYYVDGQCSDHAPYGLEFLHQGNYDHLPVGDSYQHPEATLAPANVTYLPCIENAGKKSWAVSTVEVTKPRPVPAEMTVSMRTKKANRSVRRSTASKSAAPKARPRRSGPLTHEARDRADAMRMLGACWRCRRYRKPCNDADVCSNCLTSGFRVWPSALGCFRGNMLSLAQPLMPGNAELFMGAGAGLKEARRPNWRRIQMPIPSHDFEAGNSSQKIVWTVLGTRMFGEDFKDFFDVVTNYQLSRKVRHPLIDCACAHLLAASHFYHAFVTTDIWYPVPDLHETLKSYRASSTRLWNSFVKYGLSGRRNEWFPLFLSSLLTFWAIVIWTDAAHAMPDSWKSSLWTDLQETVIDCRTRLMQVGIHLHHIQTGGTKPWKMACWVVEERVTDNGTVVLERNAEGMKLLGHDAGAFDGVMDFQRWFEKYSNVINSHGRLWFSNKPFTMQDILPVSVIWGFFNV